RAQRRGDGLLRPDPLGERALIWSAVAGHRFGSVAVWIGRNSHREDPKIQTIQSGVQPPHSKKCLRLRRVSKWQFLPNLPCPPRRRPATMRPCPALFSRRRRSFTLSFSSFRVVVWPELMSTCPSDRRGAPTDRFPWPTCWSALSTNYATNC